MKSKSKKLFFTVCYFFLKQEYLRKLIKLHRNYEFHTKREERYINHYCDIANNLCSTFDVHIKNTLKTLLECDIKDNFEWEYSSLGIYKKYLKKKIKSSLKFGMDELDVILEEQSIIRNLLKFDSFNNNYHCMNSQEFYDITGDTYFKNQENSRYDFFEPSFNYDPSCEVCHELDYLPMTLSPKSFHKLNISLFSVNYFSPDDYDKRMKFNEAKLNFLEREHLRLLDEEKESNYYSEIFSSQKAEDLFNFLLKKYKNPKDSKEMGETKKKIGQHTAFSCIYYLFKEKGLWNNADGKKQELYFGFLSTLNVDMNGRFKSLSLIAEKTANQIRDDIDEYML